eukprot:gene17507-20844_t
MGAQNSTVRYAPGVKLPDEEHKTCIYLDYNATTPIFPEVADEMQPFLMRYFGNPSSNHAFGRPCNAAVKQARERVAKLVGAKQEEIVFTSCGSESDNWAIRGVVAAAVERSKEQHPEREFVPHIVTSNIEHPAIEACLKSMASQGALAYTEVGVDKEGLIQPEAVRAAMRPETVLVTVMHSNNEIGSVQPIAAIADVAHSQGSLLHTDAAQSMGKVPVKADEINADLITVVGHKFGAPKGVAALYIRHGTSIKNMFFGGGQESGRRAGTENVLLIAGIGKAAEIAEREAAETSAHMRAMREELSQKLLEEFGSEDVRINGPHDASKRLPNTLSISIKNLIASQLLAEIGERVAASAGAACHSGGGPAISAVLKAIQLPKEYALGTLRLSVGRHTTREDIDE